MVQLFYSMHGDGETRADNMMGTLQEKPEFLLLVTQRIKLSTDNSHTTFKIKSDSYTLVIPFMLLH